MAAIVSLADILLGAADADSEFVAFFLEGVFTAVGLVYEDWRDWSAADGADYGVDVEGVLPCAGEYVVSEAVLRTHHMRRTAGQNHMRVCGVRRPGVPGMHNACRRRLGSCDCREQIGPETVPELLEIRSIFLVEA